MTRMDVLGFVPTYHYYRPDDPAPGTGSRNVADHTRHITTTYEQKGAAQAAAELAQAARDTGLTADQRKELLTNLRPVIDKIAEDLGKNSRRTDLPQSGQSGKTNGIDDQQEYKSTLGDLAAAVQQGDAAEAQRIADSILRHIPAPKSESTTAPDRLGLFGDGLREFGIRNPMLREAVSTRLTLDQPQNPPSGTELGLPKDVRVATAKALVPPVASPYNVPDGSDPAALRAYTDWAVQQSRESEKLAAELKEPFDKGKKRDDDPVGWEMYVARRTAANSDRVRAEQAIAAELRAVYKGDPKNKFATERLAQQIATRYPQGGTSKDPLVDTSATEALKLVLGETETQRNTNIKLYEVHRADDKLNALMLDKQAGKDVPDQQITNAREAFANARKALMAEVGKELDAEIPTVTGRQLREEDPRVVSANKIGARYVDDQELQAMLDAEIILRRTLDFQGPEQQMKALGDLMPRSLDPTTRAFVLSDARGAGVVDRYVDWAASQVTGAYNSAADYYKNYDHSVPYERHLFEGTPPALAATQKLRELTDPSTHPYVKPDIVARIFNKLRTPEGGNQSTMDRIISDVALEGKWHRVLLDKDNPHGGSMSEYPTYNTVIKNLSFAMENMGRVQDAETGQYPPAIEAEVAYLGRKFAELAPLLRNPGDGLSVGMPPYASRLDVAFKLAASEGSVILALETAKQLTKPGANFEKTPYREWDRHAQANLTVKYVREGIDAFHKNTKELFNTVNKNMAPVSSPLARFGTTMTEEQTQAAVAAIFRDTKDGEKLYHQMLKDREAMDLRGYQLIRLGETVGFYKHSLNHLGEYGGTINARDNLLDSKESTSMVMLSNTATLAIGSKVALKMIGSDRSNGQLMPQKYGWVGQGADFAEYWAETYVLQKRGVGVQPGSPEYGTWGDPGKRHTAYSMPAGVSGTEQTYNPGEGRTGQTANGRGGTYVRNLTAAGIEENNYNATRLARFPLAGAAVWGVGGYSQYKLWEYVHNEVGFNKNEEWRKPFLEGVVGGFAAFHLIEAGVALSRLPPETWRSMKNAGWLQTFQSKAPLLYQSFDSALDRNQAWTRFAVTGTKGLTGSLAGLMAIASVWDISGIAYRAFDQTVEHQGVWGSKWWKVGTHGVNAVSDVLLLRLQLREFAKRAAPGLIEAGLAEGALAKGATKVSASRVLSWAGSRALSANPIGFWVNVAYLATTGVNWVVDQNRHIKDLEHYDNAFLRGAGVEQPQADLLKKHAFWTGDGKGDGFALGYQAVGGDPAKFVEYLNSQKDLKKLEAAIEASGELPEHVHAPDKQPAVPVAVEYFLSLPAQVKEQPGNANTRIVFNEKTGRFEDGFTHMYFDNGKWIYYGAKDAGPGADQLVSFDPLTRKVTKTDGSKTWEEEILVAGLKQQDPHTAYLALPDGDPSGKDLKNFPTVHYNDGKKRFEDSATGLYYDKEMKAWRREDNIGDMGYYYYPDQQASVYYWPMGHRSTKMGPTGVEGWQAYLKAHDLLPPMA